MSPEYGKDADNNYNLALLRWACRTLIGLNRRYKLDDPLVPAWQATLDDLVAPPVNKNGLRIGANLSFARSHRHWSHMLRIHPLHILSDDQPENRDLIARSVEHWLAVDHGREIFGWFARHGRVALRDAGRRPERHRPDPPAHGRTRSFVRPNTQYVEGDPVIECSIVLDRSLQDMLLQSWGDKINVFPAVPQEWDTAVFHDLRAEGAFLVSADAQPAGRDGCA